MARGSLTAQALRGILLSPNRADGIPLPWLLIQGGFRAPAGHGHYQALAGGGSCLALLCGPDKTQPLESYPFPISCFPSLETALNSGKKELLCCLWALGLQAFQVTGLTAE